MRCVKAPMSTVQNMFKAAAFEMPPMLRQRLIQLALQTAARVLLIQGPPASGKTVLLRQLADALKSHGHEVALHVGVPEPSGNPTRPVAPGDVSPGAGYILIDVTDA